MHTAALYTRAVSVRMPRSKPGLPSCRPSRVLPTFIASLVTYTRLARRLVEMDYEGPSGAMADPARPSIFELAAQGQSTRLDSPRFGCTPRLIPGHLCTDQLRDLLSPVVRYVLSVSPRPLCSPVWYARPHFLTQTASLCHPKGLCPAEPSLPPPDREPPRLALCPLHVVRRAALPLDLWRFLCRDLLRPQAEKDPKSGAGHYRGRQRKRREDQGGVRVDRQE